MKRKNYGCLVPIGIFIVGCLISFFIYQQVPDDKKWLFWLLMGK